MFKYLNKKRQKGPGPSRCAIGTRSRLEADLDDDRQGRGGQSTLEYAILIIIIIGALLSIQAYIKRGVQGRLKSATDDIGDQFSVGNTNVTKRMTTFSQTEDTFSSGVTRSQLREEELTTEQMNSDIVNVKFEYWG